MLLRFREFTCLLFVVTACHTTHPETSKPVSDLDPFVEQSVSQHMRLPSSLKGQRAELAASVVAAQRIVSEFASQYGWATSMKLFFPNGVEIFETQDLLWSRIKEIHKLPEATKIPTSGLAAMLEGETLLAVSPAAYQEVAPSYARKPGAHTRLLAHEIAHRLHVSILDGDEEAMGPQWFFEGFAVIAVTSEGSQLIAKLPVFTQQQQDEEHMKSMQQHCVIS